MIVYHRKFLLCIIIYFQFNLSLGQTKGIRSVLSDKFITQNMSNNNDNYGYIHETKNFLFYKSNVIYERSCNCEMGMSCSCCESVVLLFSKSLGQLCGNLVYRPEGLNVNITLDGNTIRSMTVTNYRPLKICALIPKSLFSIICLNILELNLFPRSITACPRLEIATKNQNWKINYTCVSISTPMGSEVDSLIVNNSNRLTNNGVVNTSATLGNQTILMQNVSPPKQTQSQLSAMAPGVITLLNTDTGIKGMTPETPKPLPTSPMMNFMQPSNVPVSPPLFTSTLNASLPVSSGATSTSSMTKFSSRSLPYTATTKFTSKKSPDITETQTNFRNYSIASSTASTVNPKKFTPDYKNTISMSSRNLPHTTTTMLATTKQSSINFTTLKPSTSSSSITETIEGFSGNNETTITSTLINSEIPPTVKPTPTDNQKIAETINETLTPIISIIPIIFPVNYSTLYLDEFNLNDTNHDSITSEQSSFSTEAINGESTETTLEIMSTTQIKMNNSDQSSDDQTTQSTTLNSSIEYLEDTTTSQNV